MAPRLRSCALLAVFAAQESIEGALTPGHPGGLAALVGNGGWVAVPLAIAIGLLVALMLRGAPRASYAVAGRLACAIARRPPLVLSARPAPPPRRFAVLASAAGRAPPCAS